MSGLDSQRIATIYRQVLTESLTSARTMTAGDADAQRVIEQAFNAAIPVTVPQRLPRKIEGEAMRVALTAEAARLLVRLCTEMPLPHSPFIAAVARAAQRKA
jgi:hypothetical protein